MLDPSLLIAEEDVQDWAQSLTLEGSAVTDSQQQATEAYEQVCYGMIYRSLVQLKGDMFSLRNKLKVINRTEGQDYQPFRIAMSSEEQVFLFFPDGTEFGVLNDHHSKTWKEFVDDSSIEFEALAQHSVLHDTISRAEKSSDAKVRVNINVYGPISSSKDIGNKLSMHKTYLQNPHIYRVGYTYENPHVITFPEIQPSSSVVTEQIEEATGNTEPEKSDAERFRKTVNEVYSSLKRGAKLDGFKGDERLNTKLLTHQEQALEFMIQRESGEIPDEFRLWHPIEIEGQRWYIHSITNHKSTIPYEEKGGGILADEMGMGKSLSILSLMMRTLEDGENWANEKIIEDEHRLTKLRSRATLVIVSSALLINGWLEEIRQHLGVKLRTVKYHGQRRKDYSTTIEDNDIVITTYNTISSEYRNKYSILHNIAWYRIVLDEAHVIRRQATDINRTVSELTAKSRWLLTGTPIQNRLEDIGALFSFLRARPFDSMANFRRYIVNPFEESEAGRELATQRLTTLIDSLCLRRTKELLNLPEEQSRTRMLTLSLDERSQYERTKTFMVQAIKQSAGEFDRHNTFSMFQAQLQLRILCNHGTFQHHFQFQRRSLRDEQEDALCSSGGNAVIQCSSCKRSMPTLGSNKIYRTFAEDCAHILCSECLESSDQDSGLGSSEVGDDDTISHCPPCSATGVIAKLKLGTASQQSEARDDDYFRSEGHSTKMVALMQDVKQDLENTKSIIFSCWTRTLNLIGKHLANVGIRFERIDGECPVARRQQILNDFERDPNIRVLIMTTGTGAFGLNLTTANRVFIVEPQWNPSIENQAIARALRLGQGQQVLVTRYVIKNTIEQEMRSQQERKLKMAEIGFDADSSLPNVPRPIYDI
ncbi:hypothetical protein EV356DRAFT_453359 [Viridothelium virens]|uniref:Uncharacterized protein n=1 Tax=Viridothelium virens TaxID=1048519 RepID=A0A6A6GYM8_VIRVR|nr:hypothetical protein EV356DRAFT_453359 [Viridothelium virens]